MVTSLAMQLGVSSLCGGREKGEGQDGGGGGGGYDVQERFPSFPVLVSLCVRV